MDEDRRGRLTMNDEMGTTWEMGCAAILLRLRTILWARGARATFSTRTITIAFELLLTPKGSL